MKYWVYGKALVVLALSCLPHCSESEKQSASVPEGQKLLSSKGCTACHSINGQPGVAPTLLHLFGKNETFTDGTSVTVDEAYLKESITQPAKKVVRLHQPVMPLVPLTESELQVVVDYIKALK